MILPEPTLFRGMDYCPMARENIKEYFSVNTTMALDSAQEHTLF